MQTPELWSQVPQEEVLTRHVDVEATVEEVWEALATEEGRERWLEDDPDRELVVEDAEPPRRISWWWWSGEAPASRVVIRVVGIPTGARVTVTETAPGSFPLAQMAASFQRTLVFA